MALIRPVGIIIGVFAIAVAVGFLIHPVAKQKRQRLIHTQDGETLEIVDEAERVSRHG